MLQAATDIGVPILLAVVAALIIERLRGRKRTRVTLQIDIKE